MLSKRSLSVVTHHEAQALQWMRSGRCTRCFHLSLWRTVGEEEGKPPAGSDGESPHNVPQRGKTRHQRAALVSQEVQMLQRDRPAPTFKNPDPDTLRPPGAGQTVDPEAIGLNGGSGRMGENDAPTQDGPLSTAQGATLRGGRSDVDASVDTRAARSTGQPVTVEDAAERGGSGLEAGLRESNGMRLGRSEREERAEDTGVQFKFESSTLSSDELLHDARSSTIAASNLARLIDERIHAVSELDVSAADQINRQQNLLRRLRSGRLVRFQSREEKAAVLQAAKDAGRRQSRSSRKSKSKSSEQNEDTRVSDSEEGAQSQSKVYKVAPLPSQVQDALVEKLVKGTYDAAGVLSQGDQGTQSLNQLAKVTLMNSTYLNLDRERLLRKVRGLMPAAQGRR